jgi:phytoene synthase
LPEHLSPGRTGTDDPLKRVSDITKASGTSFAAGMNILSKPRREAMHAVYAFCRLVDDIADGPFPRAEKHRGLDMWRAEIEALYAGAPQSAVGQALSAPTASYDLPKAEFLGMIDGMAMDADGPIRAPSQEKLSLYTRRVAGTVGILSIRIFGAWRGEVSDRFALALGDAFQLTNILRDVEEDASIGRLYLPCELLRAHGLSGRAPSEVAASPELPAIRRSLAKEAASHYDAARGLAREHDRASLRPALMMMGAYEAYLRRMQRLDFRLDPAKPLLNRWQKLGHGLRYAAFGPGTPERA